MCVECTTSVSVNEHQQDDYTYTVPSNIIIVIILVIISSSNNNNCRRRKFEVRCFAVWIQQAIRSEFTSQTSIETSKTEVWRMPINPFVDSHPPAEASWQPMFVGSLNPLKPNSSNYYTLPYRPITYHFEFLTFGHSGAQLWAPECPNVRN